MIELKQALKSNKQLMSIFAGFYTMAYGNFNFLFRIGNSFNIDGAFLKGNKINCNTKNNEITIGAQARIINCKFTIIGNNCKIIIGGGSTIVSNVHFWCQDDNSSIYIGDNFTMQSGHIAATEGKSITIGNDCMFSNDVEIRNGDSHSILSSRSLKRINHAENVNIGSHVWLTAHVRILKGSSIPNDSIIGNSSIVTSKFEISNALYSGIPCKIIKEDILWDRDKIDYL